MHHYLYPLRLPVWYIPLPHHLTAYWCHQQCPLFASPAVWPVACMGGWAPTVGNYQAGQPAKVMLGNMPCTHSRANALRKSVNSGGRQIPTTG